MIVIGLNRIPELNCIEKNDFGISVGATVTISKLEKSLNTSVQELPGKFKYISFFQLERQHQKLKLLNNVAIYLKVYELKITYWAVWPNWMSG